MRVDVDKNSGFCFGVVNAIKKAEEFLNKQGFLYCLGDIVHNGMEVQRLEQKGLKIIEREEFFKLRDCTVLLRAHGEPPETYEIARKNNITIIDATCPVVIGLQNKIRKAYDNKLPEAQIVIYGKQGHAEVNGLVGQTGGDAIVISKEEDLSKVDFSKPIHLFSQTTQSINDYADLHKSFKNKVETENNNNLSFNDTICRAVSNRESELRNFARNHDAIIFVSGKKSSNGKFLMSVCKEENANTFFVSNLDELADMDLTIFNTIGVCGATSTPSWLMEKIADAIKETSKSKV